MRTRDSIHRKRSPFFGPERFTYQPESNSLSLSCRATTELWWPQLAEPHLRLHWDPQTLWCVCAESAMYQRSIPVSCYSHGRTGPAARPRVSEDARVYRRTTTKKEGGSIIRRTEESDRTQALTPAPHEVRARAVLPCRHCPEPETSRPIYPRQRKQPSSHSRLKEIAELSASRRTRV